MDLPNFRSRPSQSFCIPAFEVLEKIWLTIGSAHEILPGLIAQTFSAPKLVVVQKASEKQVGTWLCPWLKPKDRSVGLYGNRESNSGSNAQLVFS